MKSVVVNFFWERWKYKDKSDENYYNVRYDNKFNKISEIRYSKFFGNRVYKCSVGAITQYPPSWWRKSQVPPTTQVPNKKDFADTNDNSTANVCRSSTQNPNKKDFDVKYIRG